MKDEKFEEHLNDMVLTLNSNLFPEAKRLWKSGGIDRDMFDDDSYMPIKICLAVAIENCFDRFKPRGSEFEKIYKNLRKF